MPASKEYETLKKKYKLPDWKWVERNFIFKVEQDIQILVQLRRAMADRLDTISEILEPIITPAENYSSFLERKMLSIQEREKTFEIYKQLQSFLWASDKISLEYDEREYVEWIISMKDFWEKIKSDLASLFKKNFHWLEGVQESRIRNSLSRLNFLFYYFKFFRQIIISKFWKFI